MNNLPKLNLLSSVIRLSVCLTIFASFIGVSFIPNVLAENKNTEQRWRRLLPSSEPQRRGQEGGGKGESFCAVAPDKISEVEQVLNERPIFTWTGNIVKVEIREQGNGTVVWSRDISAKNQVNLNFQTASSTPFKLSQVAVEKPLKPNQIYELQVFTRMPTDYRPILFRIMTPEERNNITQGLQNLQQELAAKNITGEAAILQRADYFARQQLWSEFWQEVLSIESPSEDLKALINDTVNQLCFEY
ncbi:hypothetical protein VB834_28460 [Limnoraphis robusta Tam1]|uniref:DUF928 domain-containing protein n=1 Tax=Limnoraphis robusta CCNP1315 TaxID=3110306 RepID=A0ABU5TR33_9CYAN|nr:hypothetical protein [Limnoraphis robusta]MEA5497568.1 hypothetical protein [Limnoraphis robusta BA-68 BA1]MEA5517351.1 hypothetical protein [Limnoraphis robusta CCNP1315]MEA5542969.1 hypothetical protein [Limnoraphis robusta Tam1]MEA5546060.1 hypothetical protein [Limnoraphis robusta CCNP1324]